MKQHRSERSKLKPKCEITICSLQWLQVKRSVVAIDEKNGERYSSHSLAAEKQNCGITLKNTFVFFSHGCIYTYVPNLAIITLGLYPKQVCL